MKSNERLPSDQRSKLLDELEKRYSIKSTWRSKLFFFWKKTAWVTIVEASKITKRIVDIVGSITLMVFFSPLFLIIPFAIKLYDGGPVIYARPRIWKWGEEFLFPKFRTMRVDADRLKKSLKSMHTNQKTFKLRNDPRVTPLGIFLRKSSLDELPQLWCVLKGEMSLVGPRPPLPEEVSTYTIKDRKRLNITPGLTGIWQVSGRSELPFEKQLELDDQYIQSQSIWGDLIILAKTIPAVLFGRGAY